MADTPATAAPTPEPKDDRGLMAYLEAEATPEALAKKAPGPTATPEPPKDKAEASKPAPEPTAGEKKASQDPTADDDDAPPASLTAKAKEDWSRIREARRKAEDENKALKKKIAELETTTKASDPAEVESLRKQVKDLSDRLTVVDVERHPKFQKYFDERNNALIDSAKRIGGDKIASILQMPDTEYRTALLRDQWSELDPVAQSRLGHVLNSFEELKAQRQAEIGRAGEAYKAIQTERAEQSRREAEQANQLLEGFIEKWSNPEKGVPVFQTREGDKEWNTEVEKRKEYARNIFNGKLDMNDLARATLWAASGPELVQQLKGLQKKYAELEEENKALKAVKPSISGGGSSDGDTIPDNAGYLDAVFKAYARR
jgi:hypothetical protein